MKPIRHILFGAAITLATGATGAAVVAKTPANMLVIAGRIDDITTLDPAQSFEFSGGDVSHNLYSKLVNFNPLDLAAGYVPDLAKSWTISPDGKTITFKMRPGVKFASGDPVTAKDAQYSLRRAVLLKRTPSFILDQFGFTPENVKNTIVATGPMTLKIVTDKRYAASFVLNSLTATIGGIVDSKVVKAHAVNGDMGNAWLRTHSAGSGPYVLGSWKPNESITLVANPTYYGGAPAMKKVIVRNIQQSSTQRLLLERGDIDVARNLNPDDIAGIRGKPGLAVDSELRGRLMYIAFNQKNKILANPKVVEALKYLIDYKGMQDSFLKGQYVIHETFLPATFLGAIKDKPYSLNIAKAKKLLAEAGYSNGFSVGMIVRQAQERLEMAQSIQNTFAKAGIKVKITVGTGKQILGIYRARKHDIYLGAWGPDYPDPNTNASTFAWNGNNSDAAGLTGVLAWRNSWFDPKITKETEAAMVENNRAKRAKMYEATQRQFLKVAPFAIMFQKIEQTGRSDKVKHLNLGGAVTAVSYWPVTK